MTYPGGKNGAGVYQRIISLMPPHRVYIEPFCGGGAIFRLKRPAAINIAVDLAEAPIRELASSYDVRLGSGDGVCPLWGRGRASSVELEMTADIAGSGAAAGGIAIADGARWRASAETVYEFRHQDGIDFLRSYLFLGDELVYCDPPYLISTRSGRRLYEHEMSVVDHRRLLRWAIAANCMVIISGYWSKLYAELLAGWNTIQYDAMTRGGSVRREFLWFNFPLPVELHDYRFLGEGFRERERIKRKKARWVARLKRMPLLERQALLLAIADAGDLV